MSAGESGQGWLHVLNKCHALANEIQADIHKRNQMGKDAGGGYARASAEIRRKMGFLSESMQRMRDELNQVSLSPSQYHLTEGEVNRRRGVLETLQKQREFLLEQVRGGTTERSSASKERGDLFAKKEGYGTRQPGEETEATRDKTNREIVGLQQQVIAQQDTNLDSLHSHVVSTKQIGFAISEELDLHKGLLDDLDHSVDRTRSNLARENTRVTQVLRKSKSWGGLCCVILLVVVLIVLTFTQWT